MDSKVRTLQATATLLGLLLAQIVLPWRASPCREPLLIRGQDEFTETCPFDVYADAHPDLFAGLDIKVAPFFTGRTAKWTVSGDSLWLVDLSVLFRSSAADSGYQSVMSTIFPGQSQVFAQWFTGYLVIPTSDFGEVCMVGYYDDLQCSLLTVENGLIQAERRMEQGEHQELRQTQFRAYQRTPEYARLILDLRSEYPSAQEDQLVEFIRESGYPRYMTVIFPESPQDDE